MCACVRVCVLLYLVDSLLLSDSKPIRLLRYAAPLITFPMGAGGEAYAAYLVLSSPPSVVQWRHNAPMHVATAVPRA